MEEASKSQDNRRHRRGFILGSLSIGHGLAHLYDLGLFAVMPAIASSFGLSNFRVAAMHGLRLGASGVVNLGGGPVVDMLKRQWGLVLIGCMLWFAVSHTLIGASPNFGFLIIAVTIASMPGPLWHLPSSAALSQRFPDRRGFAISIHGFGANIGNVLGPLVARTMLRILPWRLLFFVYVGPALLVSCFLWWSVRDLGKEGPPQERNELSSHFRDARELFKSPIVMGLVLAAILRGVALSSLFNWTPFYLEDDLGMGHIKTGFHLSLLTGLGIISLPIMGIMSDKFGRKQVLIPSLFTTAALSLMVVGVGDGYYLTLVLAGMGLFSFGLFQIIQAAVLDQVGRGTEATSIGLIFGLTSVFSGVSPVLAAFIINNLGGYGSIFYYSGALTIISAFVIIIIPLRPKGTPSPTFGSPGQVSKSA